MMNYLDNEKKMERATKGLKAHGYTNCEYCPYWATGPHRSSECKQLARDALSLLEAQKQEIKDLKQEIEGQKDNLRETFDEMMRYADKLKAQAVEPILDIRHGKSMWRCGLCSTALQPNQMHAKFCFNCGKAVKWK